jgi:hypothetical protein
MHEHEHQHLFSLFVFSFQYNTLFTPFLTLVLYAGWALEYVDELNIYIDDTMWWHVVKGVTG